MAKGTLKGKAYRKETYLKKQGRFSWLKKLLNKIIPWLNL